MELPYGVIGNTADFDSVIQGSSPCGTATLLMERVWRKRALLHETNGDWVEIGLTFFRSNRGDDFKNQTDDEKGDIK